MIYPKKYILFIVAIAVRKSPQPKFEKPYNAVSQNNLHTLLAFYSVFYVTRRLHNLLCALLVP